MPSGPASKARVTVGATRSDVPLAQLDDLVVELDAAGAGDHDVGLLLRDVAVADRRAEARGVGHQADAEVL